MIKLNTFGPLKNEFKVEGAKSFAEVKNIIDSKSGAGNDFLGWLDYASKFPESELDRLLSTAKRIRENYDALVVVGIGGSYLGARAAIEAVKGLFPEDNFPIYYLGNTLSSEYTYQVIQALKNKHFAVNVISKSGTTTEPAVAFRLLKEIIIEKYGHEELKNAIVATTDRARGALKQEANIEGYETFTIPDDVGGRYSVITPVGLLPMAVAGLNVKAFLKGVKDGEVEYSKPFEENVAYQYGARRFFLYSKGYTAEMYVSYEPHFAMLNEWLKQLYGESEGKDGKGLLPDSIVCTTDLHSMGQFVQDGHKVLFETVIHPEHHFADITVGHDDANLDGLNYLEGKKLSFINDKAYEGTLAAHSENGNVPVNALSFDKMDEYNLGNLMYFFMRGCAFSAYLLEINPFNQPGVEIYKSNMFTLLGKPKKN